VREYRAIGDAMTMQDYRRQCILEAERLCFETITQDEYEAGALVLMALELVGVWEPVHFPVDAKSGI